MPAHAASICWESHPGLWQLWRHTWPLTFISKAAKHIMWLELLSLRWMLTAYMDYLPAPHIVPSLFSVFHLIFCTCFLLRFFSDSSASLFTSSWSVCASFYPSGPAVNLSFLPFVFSSLDYLSLTVASFPTFRSSLITLLSFWLLFIASPLHISLHLVFITPPPPYSSQLKEAHIATVGWFWADNSSDWCYFKLYSPLLSRAGCHKEGHERCILPSAAAFVIMIVTLKLV